MGEWLGDHRAWLEIAAGAAVFGSLLGLVLVPWLVARIPEDYFAEEVAPPLPWARVHPTLRLFLTGLKNLFGVLFAVAGIAMLVLPGQGLLTLFLAFMLLEFPGKRRLELWLVRRPILHRVIDWIRRRAGRRPLRLPPLR